jgi:hypothetical protein
MSPVSRSPASIFLRAAWFHCSESSPVDTGSIGRDGAVGLMAALGAHNAWCRAVVHIPVSGVQISVSIICDSVGVNTWGWPAVFASSGR